MWPFKRKKKVLYVVTEAQKGILYDIHCFNSEGHAGDYSHSIVRAITPDEQRGEHIVSGEDEQYQVQTWMVEMGV